ncbi:DUF4020 domain-containing protein [Mycobacterium sherrisii]|uniref:DUF4020 domain-containing protein n=1 Tax=Mycobacterium sherrisii TaxID=243061 RepID=UPI0018DDD0B8|nr:DUF4020 domain-containing protein [Mycobacterium sherrisii]
MRIRGVEFPAGLIDAHKAGELVLFVGAGASMGAPSSLPGFQKLVELTRDEADLYEIIGDVSKAPLDEVMGRMEDAPYLIKVHERVAHHIGDPNSQPNDAHAAIAQLASTGSPRIVVTNYDEHLTKSLSPSVPHYFAPALPMGDNFEGVVYLHGALSRGADSLIVTDRDFGRAYLTDAWAARFVERMFTRYTVLFIGYSHNDVIMKYLARGLGRVKERFILTPYPGDRLWAQLGITPVEYKKGPDGPSAHDALWNALDGWAFDAGMRLLDHQERVKRLVSLQVPPLNPEDNSYLESIVVDEGTVRIFTDHARDPAWLWWAAEKPCFRTLFDQRPGTPDVIVEQLAFWFAEYFVTEEQSGIALAIVFNAGGHLGPDLAFAVSRRLNQLPTPCPTELRPWLLLAVRDARNQRSDFFDFLLSSASWTDDPDTALYLFTHLTEPQSYLMPGFLDASRVEVGVRGDDYWLREAWKKVFLPNLSDAAAKLLPVIDQHLRQAYLELVIAQGPNAAAWSSYGRTAIEPHPSDQFPGPLGFLIDAARDCIESLLNTAVPQANTQLDSWAATDILLLRRLAVHGWIERHDISAAEKVAWLQTRSWLFDSGLSHEIFRLLAEALPAIDADDTKALVDIIAAAANTNESVRARAAYILTHIGRHSPNPTSAHEALAAITAAHPELQPPERIEADGADAAASDAAPTTPDEFHSKLAADAPAIRELLIQYESKQDRFDAPEWFLMGQLLGEVVGQWPTDGFAVLDAVGADHPGISQAVIYGWGRATLDDVTAQQVLTRIGQLELRQLVHAIARMLCSRSTDWRSIPASRAVAVECWTSIPIDTPSALEGGDWTDRAGNHPAGLLAEYWILSVEAEWNTAPDAWNGLTTEVAQHLDRMLDTNDTRGEMAQVMVANSIRFLHEADAAWCERNVLPLLRWDDEERARRAWGGYLSRGGWTDELLSAGLLPLFLDTVAHRGKLEKRRGWRLLEQLAEIAVYAERNPREWLSEFIQKATLTTRVEWAEQVAHTLRNAQSDLVELQWRRWIHEYWEGRVEGRLTTMTTEEASAMAEWVLYLTDSQEEAIALALRHEAGLTSQSRVFHVLRGQNRIARCPERFADLVKHLLTGSKLPCYSGYDLPSIVQQLKTHGVSEDSIRPIREQGIRLNIPLD